MKLNNKGFAITTILYGTLIHFMLLFVSLLGILSQYRKNLEKLTESNNGTRDIVTMLPTQIESGNTITKRGIYQIITESGTIKCTSYFKVNDTADCNALTTQ